MPTHLAQLTIVNPASIDRPLDLLVGGVPLAAGAYRDAAGLRLVAPDRSAIPVQADVQARWPNGSVKWVLLCAPEVTVPAHARVPMTLEQADGEPEAASSPLLAHHDASGVCVDTGAIRFCVQRSGPLVSVFEIRTETGWESRTGELDLCMVVEHNGVTRPYAAGRGDRDVEVEVAGSLRAVVRVRGSHRAVRGKRAFGPYCLRFEVIAGRSEVRLTHSVVFDGDPEHDFVRASEISLRTKEIRGKHAFRFGADLGAEEAFPRRRAPRWAPDFRHAELYQDSCSHWRLGRRIDPSKREVFTAEGLRADGWMELSGDRGSVAVAVRDFWQNHPKSLTADAGRGELRMGLYPQRADRLDLRRYSDLAYPHTYEDPAFKTREPVPTDHRFGAHGIRKTHDVLLMLDEPNPSAATLAFNRPLMLQWSPGHMAEARAIVPTASRLESGWIRRVNGYLDFLSDEMHRSGGTGYLDFFDLPHGYDVDVQRWFHDFGGWGYINDEAMPCLGLWQAYLLTGREDVFHMAHAMARHNADIDSRHLGPWSGYGSRHNVNHWGDSCMDRRVSQPIGKRFLYYLTGDRTVLDLAEVVLESFCRQPPGLRPLNMTCDVPSLVATLMLLTESGLTDGEAWLRGLADAIAQSIDSQGALADHLLVDGAARTAQCVESPRPVGFIMFSCFGGAQAFAELAEQYDHEALRQGLVRLARYQMLPAAERREREPDGQAASSERLNTFRALDLLGYAYQVTGQTDFVRHVRRTLAPALSAVPAHQFRPVLQHGRVSPQTAGADAPVRRSGSQVGASPTAARPNRLKWGRLGMTWRHPPNGAARAASTVRQGKQRPGQLSIYTLSEERPERSRMADVRWVTFPSDLVECRGLAWLDENLPTLWRLPQDQASLLPDGVRKQMIYPSGARLRLSSDTSELRLRVQCPSGPAGLGLDIYVNGRFWGTVASSAEGEVICFAGADRESKEVTVCLPMRQELQIEALGIDSNAECAKPKAYSREHPFALYGSSIAQGVGAGRPGMSYASVLSRSMGTDYVNLGFGGAGKAEPHVTALVEQVEACCYVLDLGKSYGQQTSEAYIAMLTTLRRSHPGTPIVCITPIFSSREFYSDQYVDLSRHTRTVVRESVEDRIAQGDALLYLVEGEMLLAPQDCDGLGSDGVHPSDLGHTRIAERLRPPIEEALQAAGRPS